MILFSHLRHHGTVDRKPGCARHIIPDEATTTPGISALAEVLDDDVAVDSYALSAGGPGMGYVTFITGNGEAFTPAEEPVSIHVIRVGGGLYPGEMKVLLSP